MICLTEKWSFGLTEILSERSSALSLTLRSA